MTNPFKYRPPITEDLGWEDNWLSNGMAWASAHFCPGWCQKQNHWTVDMLDYLWADCACCLLFRGLALGLFVGLILGVGIGLVF